MLRPFLIRLSSGWIQLPEEPYKAIYVFIFYIALYGSSDNCIQPDDGLNTGCPTRNVKYFGRVFLMLNYTDITQNTYIQS